MWRAWERRENCTRIWWESPKERLGRPRRRREDEIGMDLREIGWGGGLDSTGSGQGPVARWFECGDEPSGSGCTEFVNYWTEVKRPGFEVLRTLQMSLLVSWVLPRRLRYLPTFLYLALKVEAVCSETLVSTYKNYWFTELQPSFLSSGYQESFPGREANHSPSLVPRSRMSRRYISCPPCRMHGGSGTAL
jgi:hypothetical protein